MEALSDKDRDALKHGQTLDVKAFRTKWLPILNSRPTLRYAALLSIRARFGIPSTKEMSGNGCKHFVHWKTFRVLLHSYTGASFKSLRKHCTNVEEIQGRS